MGKRGAAFFVSVALALAVAFAGTATADSPNPSVTPGAAVVSVTQGNIGSTVCRKGYASEVRSVSSGTKREVFAEYGIPKGQQHLYVIDHLIPLEVGGANVIQNLWPEPKGEAKVKDKEENALHSDVCAGDLTLADAQHIAVEPVATGLSTALNAKSAARRRKSSTDAQPPQEQQPPNGTSAPAGGGSAPTVHPGAFCAPGGARGVTTAGTPMVCGPASDGRNRWHSG